MPRKPMSSMTDQDLIYIQSALEYTHQELAHELSRVLQRRRAYSRNMITMYVTGRAPIPQDVADAAHTLCVEKMRKFHGIMTNRDRAADQLHSLRIRSGRPGLRGKHDIHPTKDRIMRRQRRDSPERSPVMPAYRVSAASRGLLIKALVVWREEQQRRLKDHAERPAWVKDAQLELADIKAIAASLPRDPPYDIHLTWDETDVCFRALRHAGTTLRDRSYTNLYLHWISKRGTEYKGGRRMRHDDNRPSQQENT